MFRSGRRLFSAASLGLIIVAVLHTIGSFAPPPPDPALERLSAELRAYRFPLGLGMAPSLYDIQQSLALTMGVTLLWLGAGNLVAAATDDAAGRVVRGFNVVNVLGLALLVGLFAFYRIPPPLLTLAAVEALFVLALALPARRRLGRGP